jgi:hypothetical protein
MGKYEAEQMSAMKDEGRRYGHGEEEGAAAVEGNEGKGDKKKRADEEAQAQKQVTHS